MASNSVESIVSIPGDRVRASMSGRRGEGISEPRSYDSLVNVGIHDRTTVEIAGEKRRRAIWRTRDRQKLINLRKPPRVVVRSIRASQYSANSQM